MDKFKVTALDWDGDLVQAFEPSLIASCAGQGTAAEMLQGCYAFDLQAGARRAIVAVHPVRRVAGDILEVCALVSLGDRLQVAAFDGAVLDVAKRFDAKVLQMTTMHPHMVRGCLKNGWNATGTTMQKHIRGVH